MSGDSTYNRGPGTEPSRSAARALSTRAFGVAALAALLLVAAMSGLRFANLGAKVYWHDEAYSSLRVFGHTGPEYYAGMFDGKLHSIADVRNYQHADPERGIAATLAALASRPEHPPLYYLMARFWAALFDDPVLALRSLSAVFGLLLLPAVYWFAREVFDDERVSWAAVVLAAASPLHLLYAQEARQYALWLTLTALSGAALLHALRTDSRRTLGVYALTVALGLYAHLMHAFTVAAQALFLLWMRDKFPRARLKAAATALAFGVLALAPWVVLLLNAIPDVVQVTGWMQIPVSALVRVQAWFININRLFFDFPGSVYLTPVSAGLAVAAVYTVSRGTPSREWRLPVLLLAISGGAVILPDVVDGGRRSLEARYLLPALLLVQLCVAHLIGTRTSLQTRPGRVFGLIGLLIIVGGVYSQLTIVSSDTWWNKSFSANNRRIAAAVNAAERPLLIAGLGEVNPGELLSLSYLLDDRVGLLLLGGGASEGLPEGYSQYFVLNPAWDQLRWRDPAYTAHRVADGLGVWELRPRADN